jgi:vacuolar-type H+-ATPase subunit H
MRDKIQITLNRTQATILESLLRDADQQNTRDMWEQESRAEKPGQEYLMSYANSFRKRASTARVLAQKIRRVYKDKRRVYLDVSDELFPVSK